jgi:hypothetical protein
MTPTIPTIVALAMGSLLIVAGIALIGYEVAKKQQRQPEQQQGQGQAEAATPVHTPKFSVSSPYPGVILVGLGVILLLATLGMQPFSN